jgi:hypothetical protein
MIPIRTVFWGALTIVCGAATAFFTYFGIRLIYAAVTFDGEGSLGHVGMFIAAGLYPLLAFVFGGFTYLAWRSLRPVPPMPPA